jgi:hypothetical protein
MQEATGHGVMSLGRGELVPVEKTDGFVMTTRAIQAGLRTMSLNHVQARSGPRIKGPRVKFTIGWMPVICTLEEDPEEPGVIDAKARKAEVVIRSDQRAAVDKLVAEQGGAFASNEDEVKIAKGLSLNIDLIDRNHVEHRRIPYHVGDELTERVIRWSNSPYCNGLVIVRKSDASLKICEDYKDLNSKTAEDDYQLPLVEDQLNRSRVRSASQLLICFGGITS